MVEFPSNVNNTGSQDTLRQIYEREMRYLKQLETHGVGSRVKP